MGVNFVRKKFTLLPTTIGICRSENTKKIGGVNFTSEICHGVNERIKVENPCIRTTKKTTTKIFIKGKKGQPEDKFYFCWLGRELPTGFIPGVHYSCIILTMSKRKHVFRDEYEKEFAEIQRSRKGDGYAHCCICDADISLVAMGKTAITVHNATKKHCNARRSAPNEILKNKDIPINLKSKTAAAEIAWAFHTAQHQQLCLTNDCITGLFRALFCDSEIAKKFASNRTKTATIITEVLAPHARKSMLSELGDQPFSISISAFYHDEVKLFALVIRFFNARLGARMHVLDLRVIAEGTSQQIVGFVRSAVEENGLDLNNMTSFCADSSRAYFGCLQYNEHVYHHLKDQTRSLIQIACAANIFCITAETGADRLTVDIETISMKLCSYFKSQTNKVSGLTQFYTHLDASYSTLLTNSPTRWSTLSAVLERMINLWQPLKEHFLSLKHPPRILETFFKSETSLAIVSFLHSALLVFKKPLLLLQNKTALFPELECIIESFKEAIQRRQDAEFFGTATAELLQAVDEESAERLKSSFQEYYSVALHCIDKWYRLENHPVCTHWTLLKKKTVRYEEVRAMAKQVTPQTAMDDELFDEVSLLNVVLEKIPNDVFNQETCEIKWVNIFSENPLPLIYKLVSIIFSIPTSNAFVDRELSLISAHRAIEKNNFDEKGLKSLLQVKVNLDLSCFEMYDLISKNRNFLTQIVCDEP